MTGGHRIDPGRTLAATLDTAAINERGRQRLAQVGRECPVEIAHTTVSDREHASHKSDRLPARGAKATETAIWDEPPWGQAVWGGEEDSARLEEIINIITSGSPLPR